MTLMVTTKTFSKFLYVPAVALSSPYTSHTKTTKICIHGCKDIGVAETFCSNSLSSGLAKYVSVPSPGLGSALPTSGFSSRH